MAAATSSMIALAVGLDLRRAGDEQFVGGNFNADQLAVLADFQARNADRGERLLDAAVGRDRRPAAKAGRGFEGVHLLLGILLGELRILVALGDAAEFLLEQGNLLLGGGFLLGLLSQLTMQIGVVEIELGHAAIEVLHLRGQGLRLLRQGGIARGRGRIGRRLERTVLAARCGQCQCADCQCADRQRSHPRAAHMRSQTSESPYSALPGVPEASPEAADDSNLPRLPQPQKPGHPAGRKEFPQPRFSKANDRAEPSGGPRPPAFMATLSACTTVA